MTVPIVSGLPKARDNAAGTVHVEGNLILRPVAAVVMAPAVVLARPRSPTIAASIGSAAMDVATPTNNTNERPS
jgi:hypothetical protein